MDAFVKYSRHYLYGHTVLVKTYPGALCRLLVVIRSSGHLYYGFQTYRVQTWKFSWQCCGISSKQCKVVDEVQNDNVQHIVHIYSRTNDELKKMHLACSSLAYI